MTNKQIKKFNQLLDANWNYKQAIEKGNYTEAFSLADQVHALKQELREDMGAIKYDTFILNGRKMFS
jgi:protein-arginine kinase activator protein McsA